MKKTFLLLVCGLILAGCHQSSDTKPAVEMTEPQVQAESINMKGVGQRCGGVERLKCAPKLNCIKEVAKLEHYGTCQSTVVDTSMECPETQAPVCGLREGNKNAYLNDCEARRHGAEVLYAGFCKYDTTRKNSCELPAVSMGNCDDYASGFEYQNGTCKEVFLSGCEFEIPFETQEDCRASCNK